MKRLKWIYLIVLIGVFSLSQMLGMEAFAQEKNPCSDDLAKFCPEVKSDDMGAIMNCLETHEGELSDACKAYEERMGGSRAESRERTRQYKAVLQDCRDDVTKFCRET